MIVECSILLLLLANCIAFLDSNNQDKIKRSNSLLEGPQWRLLQRNRELVFQPFARPPILIAFPDRTRSLLMRTEHPYPYDFGG